MSGARPAPAMGYASLAITALIAALLAANSLDSHKPGDAPAQPQAQKTEQSEQTAKPENPVQTQPLTVALPPPPAAAAKPAPQTTATPAPATPTAAKMKPLHVTPLAPEPEPTAPATLMRQPLKPAAQPKPLPQPQPQPVAEPVAVTVTAETVTDGRTMLRLLEHGEGPGIEIAWPASADERRRLYRLFHRCFGMRTALIDNEGRLFVAESAPGVPWALDTDQFSGFMRQPDGALVVGERDEIERIRQRHGNHLNDPVRLFPRRLDAILLGGLRQAIGSEPTLGSGTSIRARYRVAGDEVMVEGIQSSGRAVPGRINLSRAAGIRTRSCAP